MSKPHEFELSSGDFAASLYKRGVHKSGAGVPLWYLATPYRVPRAVGEELGQKRSIEIAQARHAAAVRIAANLMMRSYRVFCPIAHTVPMEPYLEDVWGAEDWLIADEPFIMRCSGLVIGKLPGWELSGGVEYERQRFKEQGKPISKLDVRPLFNASEWHELELDHEHKKQLSRRAPNCS